MRSRNVQNGVTNVISLGLSFFSGIFVPLDQMTDSVLSVARFTPTYWYVKNTDDIASLSSFTSASLSPIFISMLIQLGFAVAFLGVALVIAKQKQTKSII
jgi:ABC-2 type transport system permease protein